MIGSLASFAQDKYFFRFTTEEIKILASFTYHDIAILHLLTSVNCLSDVGSVDRGSVVNLCLLH